MKTKTSILTALVALASGTCAMAQVYSQNVVGYVNVNIPTGFSMIANQLETADKKISTLLPAGSVPDGTTVYKWNGTTFASRIYDELDEAWGPDGDLTFGPGEGLFIRNSTASPFSITFVGEVLQGNLSVSLTPGFSIVSSKVPQAGLVDQVHQFPNIDGATIYRFINNNAGGGGYVSSTYDELDEAWGPTTPDLKVGEAFWVRVSSSASWSRSFTVN